MATWIHFTEDIMNFADGLKGMDSDALNTFTDEGLCVNFYDDDYPMEETRAGWGDREPVFVECDESHVELLQEDPTGDDKYRHEYIIPVAHFDKCQIWFESA